MVIPGTITAENANTAWSIGRWSHILIIGNTTSGKTHLAKALSRFGSASGTTPLVIDEPTRTDRDAVKAIDLASSERPVIVTMQRFTDLPITSHKHINNGTALILCGQVGIQQGALIAERFEIDGNSLPAMPQYHFLMTATKQN